MTPATLTGSASGAVGRRRRPPRGGACDEPPRLFGDEPLVETPAAATAPVVEISVPVPVVEAAVSAVAGATLADLIADTWTTLTATAGPAPCLGCGADLQPWWSAGSGIVGGRCGGCGTTLE